MVNLTRILPVFYSSYTPQVQLPETDTQEFRCAKRILIERPANANICSSLFSSFIILTNPFIHLENLRLTHEQREKISQILVAKDLFEVPAVKSLDKKITFYYGLNDLLQKAYELNPSFNQILDKKELQNFSSKLEQYSIAALQECMHEHVGLKYLEQLALNYVELTVKEEWRTETWWLDKTIQYVFSKKAWQEVSQMAREQFEKLVCEFQDLEKKLCSQNNIDAQIEAIQKSGAEERSIQALKKAIEIHKIACNAMFKMPGIVEGRAIYRF